MSFAYPMQKFQDWFTQQWAILWGQRIDLKNHSWLIGPFGKLGSIGDDFVHQFAEDENLIIQRNTVSQGLITSMKALNLSDEEYARLSPKVIDFYENTSNYSLMFSVRWNPFFKIFGNLVNVLFSNRINQLNVPIKNLKGSEQINSEIITLSDSKTNEVKYTIWYRTFQTTGQVLYSGVYGTCCLPSGKVGVKAVFPLPKGNATVIMSPSVGANGNLQLESYGNRFGDSGFYFLLNDSKGAFWSNYVRSFRDDLNVSFNGSNIVANQTLTLWGMRVLQFKYKICPKLNSLEKHKRSIKFK